MNRRTKKAGKAIASGSFGCVFRPPLRCKGETNRPGSVDKPMISKLMMKHDALEEYTIIEDVKKIVKDIPNYSDYFVVDDITMCDPGELDEEDMENAVKECSASLKLGRGETTIPPNKLSQTAVITAPDMGKDIHKSFAQMSKDYINYKGSDKFSLVSKNLKKINTQIVKLLKNGVAPMIYKGIYHNDLKGQNIMTSYSSLEDVKNNFNYAKMIDFGLLKQITQNSDPQHIVNSVMSVLMFNGLIYNLIFNEDLLDIFTDIFEDIYPNLNTRYDDMVKDLRGGILQQKFLNEFIPIVEHELQYEAHWPVLQDIYRWCVFNYSGKLKNKFIPHVANILVTAFFQMIYITREDSNIKYRVKPYFNDVVRHNIDAVGLLTSYYKLCLTLFLQKEIKENMKDVVTAYADLLYEYMFSPKYVEEAISIPELVKKIENINSLLSKYDNGNNSGNNSNTNKVKNSNSVTRKSRMGSNKNTNRNSIAVRSISRKNSNRNSRPVTSISRKNSNTNKVVESLLDLGKVKSIKTVRVKKGSRCPNGYVRHPRDPTLCLSKEKLNITKSMTKNKNKLSRYMNAVTKTRKVEGF
jgi:hypothetical protein